MSKQKVVKSKVEWQKILTSEQFDVTRKRGTESAFSGEYHDCKDDGVYACVCCGTPLYSSEKKYDSGTGWPSFFAPIEEENINKQNDFRWFHWRTELLCSVCDAHIGHVFNDGPEPTGERHCINSVALKLV